MKKKILFACLVGVLSISSAYSACDGGTEIKNTAGTTFCKSDVKLNWWSAANWCKANGMHLATMYEMCPNWDGNRGTGKCPELNGKGDNYAWSATAHNSTHAFRVSLPSGLVDNENTPRHGYGYAFCR